MGMCGNRICGQVGKIKFVGMFENKVCGHVEIDFVSVCGNRISGHVWKSNLWACMEIEFMGMCRN